MKVIRAREARLQEINKLITRSKSTWDYPKDYLEEAIRLILIDPNYLAENLSFEILDESDSIVGFFSISEKESEKYLDHLWIDPNFQRKGYGAFACIRVLKLAKKFAWRELLVLPDPKAEGFYCKQGFYDTGMRQPSRIKNGPTFAVFKMNFNSSLGEVTGLSHLTITATDLSASLKFYNQVLGLKTLMIRVSESAYLRSHDFWLALVVDKNKKNAKDDYSHFAFWARGENFDMIAQKIKASHAEIWQQNDSPGRSIYFLDPSGNKLELHEYLWRDRIGWLNQHPGKEFKLLGV